MKIYPKDKRCVYLVTDGQGSKIGKSNQPEGIPYGLQRGNPRQIELLSFVVVTWEIEEAEGEFCRVPFWDHISWKGDALAIKVEHLVRDYITDIRKENGQRKHPPMKGEWVRGVVSVDDFLFNANYAIEKIFENLLSYADRQARRDLAAEAREREQRQEEYDHAVTLIQLRNHQIEDLYPGIVGELGVYYWELDWADRVDQHIWREGISRAEAYRKLNDALGLNISTMAMRYAMQKKKKRTKVAA